MKHTVENRQNRLDCVRVVKELIQYIVKMEYMRRQFDTPNEGETVWAKKTCLKAESLAQDSTDFCGLADSLCERLDSVTVTE